MGSSKVILSILAITLSLVAVTGAAAEDFTLTVPVRVAAVGPPETEGLVICSVGIGVRPDGGYLMNNEVGRGAAVFALDANGNFHGNVTVKFNALRGRNPATATHYYCELQVMGPSGSGIPADQVSREGRARPGAPLVWQVTGAFP